MKLHFFLLFGSLLSTTTAAPNRTPGDDIPYSPPFHPIPGGPGAGNADYNVLEHLGANSPWFPGPKIFNISPSPPERCSVEQAVHIGRHGSRYPDPGAYSQWTALYEKIQGATFTATGPLAFLKSWKPVLDDPANELSQVSPGGYKELYDFGVQLRTRYPGFYKYNTPFHVFANEYKRTVDSARLFTRGYIGPNSTSLGTVYAINSTSPSTIGNSLATSDSCSTFLDSSGSAQATTWDNIYLPPILSRLNTYISPAQSLNLTTSDISLFPYLCGFESQITLRLSPWCAVFTESEILQYEYRQDLRYYYGTGPGAQHNASVQLPVLQGVIDILSTGPNTTTHGSPTNSSIGSAGVLGPLTVAFTHDNQINELVSLLSIFSHSSQAPLSATTMDKDRIYVSSRITPMRGTVTFERLTCSGSAEPYLRILLNDAVYPVSGCSSGPGQSCSLKTYKDEIVAKKWKEIGGSFEVLCGLSPGSASTGVDGGATFFTDWAGLGQGVTSVLP